MAAPRIDLPWTTPAPVNQHSVENLVRTLRVTPFTADLLVRRGLSDPGAASRFFSPSENESWNPYLMKGMQAVRDRVAKAITEREPITIFGDYDADGIPGTSLLKIWLSKAGAKVSTYIPNREDGYGMTLAGAKKIFALYAPKLVITVDCGSSDHDSIKWLRSQGVDVVVTDHHETLKGAPPTPYFINPSRNDKPVETYPFKYLCGCGVAYKLIQALSTKRHETALYDLLAISTVGDQVSLTGENRFYVKAALNALHVNAQGNVGLRALVRVSGRRFDEIDATDFGWRICPRINAVGRMGADPNMVVELLSTSDYGRAQELAAIMTKLNSKRQDLTDELFNAALRSVGNKPDDVIAVYLPEATVGVAGLIAAKVVENYGRPALVVNSEGRGSGRSPVGLEIINYMNQLKDMGIFGVTRRGKDGESITPDFGGHAGACGFHNVDVPKFLSAVKQLRVPRERLGVINVETIIPLSGLTLGLAQEIDALAPFGIGNPDPAIAIHDVTVAEQTASKDGRHLFLVITDGTVTRRAVWFGAGELAGKLTAKVDLLGRPSVSSYSGEPDLMVTALRRRK